MCKLSFKVCQADTLLYIVSHHPRCSINFFVLFLELVVFILLFQVFTDEGGEIDQQFLVTPMVVEKQNDQCYQV